MAYTEYVIITRGKYSTDGGRQLRLMQIPLDCRICYNCAH